MKHYQSYETHTFIEWDYMFYELTSEHQICLQQWKATFFYAMNMTHTNSTYITCY